MNDWINFRNFQTNNDFIDAVLTRHSEDRNDYPFCLNDERKRYLRSSAFFVKEKNIKTIEDVAIGDIFEFNPFTCSRLHVKNTNLHFNNILVVMTNNYSSDNDNLDYIRVAQIHYWENFYKAKDELILNKRDDYVTFFAEMWNQYDVPIKYLKKVTEVEKKFKENFIKNNVCKFNEDITHKNNVLSCFRQMELQVSCFYASFFNKELEAC